MRLYVRPESCIEMQGFPYTAGLPWRYGCNPDEQGDLLHSILYTFDVYDGFPEGKPDGLAVVFDYDGLKEWYDSEIPAEEKEEYNCPTVDDYLKCELGRAVTPMEGVKCVRVAYRDSLGYVIVKVDKSGVSIHDRKCYFTDCDGRDHVVDIDNLVGMDEGEE